MENVIGLSEFRFGSLRKFMTPFYDSLRSQAASASDHQVFTSEAVRDFFKRLRTYRELSIEDVVAVSHGSISIEELSGYESGAVRCNQQIEAAYCKACGAFQEMEYFFYQVRAIKDPSIREGQNAVAKDVLKRFGIKMPLVDYNNLDAKRGTLLEFPKR